MAPIGPLAQIALGFVGSLAADKAKDYLAKKKEAAARGPQTREPAQLSAMTGATGANVRPPSFTAAQAALFTQRTPDGRRVMFDPPKALEMRQALGRCSVESMEIDLSPLHPSRRQAWRLVPARPDSLPARAWLEEALTVSRSGGVVVATLECIFAPIPHALAQTSDALMMVGGPDLLRLCEPGQMFALLSTPLLLAARAQAEAAAAPVAAAPAVEDDAVVEERAAVNGVAPPAAKAAPKNGKTAATET